VTARGYRWFILSTSIVPPLAVGIGLWLLLRGRIGAAELVTFAVFYALTGFGIWGGFHRLLTHRAYKVGRPLRLAITTLGVMGGEGPPIPWVAQHRLHHSVSDEDGDPHSPHLEHGPGLRGALRGLWHAHMGWLLDPKLDSEPLRYAPDLVRERDMRRISAHAGPIFVAGLVLPGLLGLALTGGDPVRALQCALFGGPVRVFFVLQVTYAVNSIGHYFGSRRYSTHDESRNVGWLAVATLGEGWHHNHHAFPTSASLRMRWWEVDPVGSFIHLLERVGLAWDVVRVRPERERAKRLPQREPSDSLQLSGTR
jgi:stearoyl-CoA desaturase (delta-9 desaturase)